MTVVKLMLYLGLFTKVNIGKKNRTAKTTLVTGSTVYCITGFFCVSVIFAFFLSIRKIKQREIVANNV